MWVIHSGELAKLVLVAILRSHLGENYYHHRHYEHEVQGLLEMVDNINGICSPNFVNRKLYSKLFHNITLLQNLTIKIDVASFQIQTLSLKSQNRLLLLQEIIVYFRSTINACSLLSHEWWVPLIKFMVGPTIYVRGGSTYLWYSGST